MSIVKLLLLLCLFLIVAIVGGGRGSGGGGGAFVGEGSGGGLGPYRCHRKNSQVGTPIWLRQRAEIRKLKFESGMGETETSRSAAEQSRAHPAR